MSFPGGIRNLSTIQCVFRQNTGKWNSQKLETDAGLGIKTDRIRDSDERISEGGIVVNNGERIRDQNLFSRS